MPFSDLVQSEWFKRFPEKILGEQYYTHDQYGKSVVRVRGTLEDALSKMPSTRSVAEYDYMLDVKNHVANDKESAIEKAIRATRNAQKPPSGEGLDLLTMDQVIKRFNPGVSRDDVELYLFYQKNRYFDKKTVSDSKNGWSKYDVKVTDQKLLAWVTAGKMCFDGKEWIPYYLFYAGNIYLKLNTIKQRESAIVAKIGKSAFDEQLRKLEAAKPKTLKILAPEGEQLYISPLDPICNSFSILDTTGGNVYDEPISIRRAFRHWLEGVPRKEFKHFSNAFDVKYHWMDGKNFPRDTEQSEKASRKRNAQMDGMALFSRFLAEELTRLDQHKLEHLWNAEFNAFKEFDFDKIPVGLELNRWFKNGELEPRKTLWQGVKFINTNGSGIIAFDVGVGKTMTAIIAVAQAMYSGQCKRPLIVVPSPTYAKWIAEIIGTYDKKGNCTSHGVLPQYKDRINDYYNLGVNYIDNAKANPPKDHTISIMTFEGMANLGFGKELQGELSLELFRILNQGVDKRDAEKLREKVDKMMGDATADTVLNIDEMGFDYLVIDEAHNCKKIFTKVKGNVEADDKREQSRYQVSSGEPSARGIKAFMISQYVLRRNNMRNVCLLTATPFTNSPLEVYSMLALVAYQSLERRGILNIEAFFDKFINESYELAYSPSGKYEVKPVVKSFNNKVVLQNIIFSNIIHKTGEEANVPRPTKIVYPLMKDENGVALPLSKQVDTSLPSTPEQEYWLTEIAKFANQTAGNAIEDLLPRQYYDGDGKIPGRVLLAITLAQNCTLSPYLLKVYEGKEPQYFIDGDRPDYKEFIDSSPKLKYVCGCIATVKAHHEKKNEDVSGQVIYMNMATDYFPLIREYLIEEVGYDPKQVEIIDGSVLKGRKERIKRDFLNGKVKIIIGSATIREGIDLQNRSTVLYNCSLDWNPTDIQQLEGRIYRQGNQFSHVRIVVPMLENSIDIFLFQKLEEKTSRINNIWYRADKGNVLKLDDFDPKELKEGLMTDPTEAAKASIGEEVKAQEFEKSVVDGYIEELQSTIYTVKEYKSREIQIDAEFRDARQSLIDKRSGLDRRLKEELYKNATERKKIETRINTIDRAFENPEDGKYKFRVIKTWAKVLLKWESRTYSYNRLTSLVDRQVKAARTIESVQKNILSKFDLTVNDDFSSIINEYEAKSKELADRIQGLKSTEHFEEILAGIQQRKEAAQKQSKPLDYRVQQFTKHNYLLSSLRGMNTAKKPEKKPDKKPEFKGKLIWSHKEGDFLRDERGNKYWYRKAKTPTFGPTAYCFKRDREEGFDTKIKYEKVYKSEMTSAELKQYKAYKDMLKAPEDEDRRITKADLEPLRHFLPKQQYATLSGAKYVDFGNVIERLKKTVELMPKVYEQDGLGKYGFVFLHYFSGGTDWYITERDMTDKQLQAYGYTVLNGDMQNAEFGYISIDELNKLKPGRTRSGGLFTGVELDFHFTPKPLKTVLKDKKDSFEPKYHLSIVNNLKFEQIQTIAAKLGYKAPAKKNKTPGNKPTTFAELKKYLKPGMQLFFFSKPLQEKEWRRKFVALDVKKVTDGAFTLLNESGSKLTHSFGASTTVTCSENWFRVVNDVTVSYYYYEAPATEPEYEAPELQNPDPDKTKRLRIAKAKAAALNLKLKLLKAA